MFNANFRLSWIFRETTAASPHDDDVPMQILIEEEGPADAQQVSIDQALSDEPETVAFGHMDSGSLVL